MIKIFFMNSKWALWAYGGAFLLLLSLTFQVWLTVQINGWYGEFYDIMQKPSLHTMGEFWDKIWMFFYIALPYVVVASITNWFTRMYGFAWREALTFDYLPKWSRVLHDIEGASQRIQEDTYKFARIVESLGLQGARAIMTLIAFLPMLWGMSSNVITEVAWLGDIIPGSLVWIALIVSLGGITVSWFVGWFLPGLEYNNQVREAAFRKELVYVEDDKDRYGDGETFLSLFTSVKLNYRRLFNHYGYFDVWMNSYDQVMVLVPYIIVGPSVMTAAITLGVLVQVSNAFRKVHESFALVLHRWTDITELRSIWKRLHEFERNLLL
ncbi:MAG: putative transporter [Candidatus Pacebacteria bacterium]|jgi:peptide/bleomycin uptake transporter|nr:putative transporter [Candidatus Paceibacterota bacterium]